jgi:acetylornithine deacetylase/succinyl-diaminopimelate desuccinylase-like protein
MELELTGETVELLSTLIRNACVNDGTVDSGNERRTADVLATYLEGAGLDVERFTSVADRTSIVARIEGSDPSAPKLCLMGHTDVVPVNPEGWSRDPFGGEVVDGELWGRGSLDMLNITASMAVAFKELARTGFQPKGDLIYFGVADEEAGGNWGAQWMIDHHWEAVACDYVLTEMGGWPHGSGDRVGITVGEKGIAQRLLTVRGTPGHGSMPYRTDNAVLKAAEVVRRLGQYQPKARLDEMWAARVMAGLPEQIRQGLLDPTRLEDTLAALSPIAARLLHACSHTTISCNMIHGGVKNNVIPDKVEITLDIRTLPGDGPDEVMNYLREALGELADDVEVAPIRNDLATISPLGTPMYEVLERQTQRAYPAATLLPELLVGATDNRHFRAKGVVAYGTGLLSPSVRFEQFASRFHGNDERIDLASLGLVTDYWLGVARDMMG